VAFAAAAAARLVVVAAAVQVEMTAGRLLVGCLRTSVAAHFAAWPSTASAFRLENYSVGGLRPRLLSLLPRSRCHGRLTLLLWPLVL
jgi:hypothetical protein